MYFGLLYPSQMVVIEGFEPPRYAYQAQMLPITSYDHEKFLNESGLIPTRHLLSAARSVVPVPPAMPEVLASGLWPARASPCIRSNGGCRGTRTHLSLHVEQVPYPEDEATVKLSKTFLAGPHGFEP